MTLMWELIIAKAQTFINKACEFDFHWNDYAKELNEKIIGIHITQIDCMVYAEIKNNQILLSTHTSKSVDLMITGSPMGLLELKPDTIEGSAHLAQTVQRMMHSLNIDWEGFIAHYTGDIVAHELGKIQTHMKTVFKRSKNAFLENLGEYLLFETEMTPTQEEVDQFIQDVTHLDYAVDRIEARIRLLTEKMTDVVQ